MRQGGETYYDQLLKEAEIPSPFQDGALSDLARRVEKTLQDIQAQL